MYFNFYQGGENILQHSPQISQTSPSTVVAHPNLSESGEAQQNRMINSKINNITDETKHISSSQQVIFISAYKL